MKEERGKKWMWGVEGGEWRVGECEGEEYSVCMCMYTHMNNQVHKALFRKEGEGKERERTTTSMA